MELLYLTLSDQIKTDMQAARDSLGLCPQHNMLFPSLTVMEHLIFFGMVGTTFTLSI